MKQLIGSDIGSYTFNASTGTITFTGVTLRLDQILLITDTTTNTIIYNFAQAGYGGSLDETGTILTLTYSTTSLSNSDALQIYVDLPDANAISTKYAVVAAGGNWNSSTAVNTYLTLDLSGSVCNSVVIELEVTGSITGGSITFLSTPVSFAPSAGFTARRVDQPYTNVTSINLASLTAGEAYVYLIDVGALPGFVANLATAIIGTGSVQIAAGAGPAGTSQLSCVGQTDPTQLNATVINNGTFAVQASGTVAVSNFPTSFAVTNTGTFAVQATDNINQWGGTAVTAATSSAPAGTETAPVVRPLNRKVAVASNSSTTALGANAVFTGTWIDTTVTGGNFVEVSCYPGAQAGNFVIQGSDDTSNSSMTQTLTQKNYSTSGVSASAVARVNQRYWRTVYTNGAVAQTTFDLQSIEMSVPAQMGVLGDGSSFGAVNSSGVTVANAVPCTLAAGSGVGDNVGSNLQIAGNGVGVNVGVSTSIYNGSTFDRGRAVNGMTAAGSPTGVQAFVEVPTTHANQASLVTGQTALTVQNIKAAAGNLFGLYVVNPNASVIYLQFYNTASTPVLGTSVVWWVPVAASYAGQIQLPYAINFTTGIGIGAATTATGSSAPGSAPIVTEFYI
jgi:hypothetical protein